MLFQKIKVLIAHMKMHPQSIIHSFPLRLNQHIQLISLALFLNPIFKEIFQKISLLLKIQIQEYFSYNTLSINKQNLISLLQHFILLLNMPSGNNLKIRYFQLSLLLIVCSPILTTELSIEILSKFLNHRRFANRFWANNNNLFGKVRFGCITDHVPMGERFLSNDSGANRHCFSLDIYILISNIQFLS